MMVDMRFTRLAGLAGILAPVITLTLIFVSIAMSPWFSWHDNALSDMGVSTTPNPFNAALLIGGLAYLVFVIGFVRWHRAPSLLAKIAGLLLAAGGIGLTLVAVLTEEAGRIHYAVAATYFLATPLAYELFGIDLLKRGQKVSGILTIAAGLAALVMIAFVPHKRIAVPEILAAVIIAAWTFAIGVQMLIEPENT
jgi:hypothetical membrane protein